MSLLVAKLSSGAFAPFGDVLTADDGLGGTVANQGSAVRRDWITSLVNQRPDARANVALFRSTPRQLPFSIQLLERHPASSQLFAPLRVERFVVVVAPTLANGQPDVTRIHCFVAGPAQAINYRAGTWHHPLIVLDSVADFLMIAYEAQSAGDCEEFHLSAPAVLELP
jgi:ureidoglycolate lyase